MHVIMKIKKNVRKKVEWVEIREGRRPVCEGNTILPF